MYDEYKVYGPYLRKDNRQHAILYDGKVRRTLSYPKYLMEMHLGRHLLLMEDVHHKDGNPLNNALSNLEVIDHAEHCREHSTKYRKPKVVTCSWCGKDFTLTVKQQRNKAGNMSRRTGTRNGNVFCSRTCSGSYGKSIQMGTSGMNVLKFGETCANGNAEPSFFIEIVFDEEEGVET